MNEQRRQCQPLAMRITEAEFRRYRTDAYRPLREPGCSHVRNGSVKCRQHRSGHAAGDGSLGKIDGKAHVA